MAMIGEPLEIIEVTLPEEEKVVPPAEKAVPPREKATRPTEQADAGISAGARR